MRYKRAISVAISVLAPLAVFSALAALVITSVDYEVGTDPQEVTEDLTCQSDVLNQQFKLVAGDKIFSWSGNKTEDYYRIKRETETVTEDGPITTTVETETIIKMYDHDRWSCTNDYGESIDYKSIAPAPAPE